ncbi:MAG: tripartite tricarboxylate transporter TctB family protein [Rhodospirillaceae bacterium]|nr:tripartite tricarboxylate transporter TctB family protein [Rhodospirillaceae bacterium]MCA8932757.1 tripartite tricarboxylate transporter TctB family protein [Rhodospirillaceae bacterium]
MRLVFAGILVAVLAAIVWQSTEIRGSAAIYPIVVSIGALVCSVAFLVARALAPAPQGDGGPAIGLRLPAGRALRLAAVAAVWLAYVVALPYAGFMVASWVALFVSLAITHGRPSLSGALGTAAFVLVFAILIKIVLYVPVPQAWPDQQLDILLYEWL